MQSFTDIQSSETLTASLGKLMDNDKTALSLNAGTAFPTTGLIVGMPCLRTDMRKLYQLADLTPTWVLIADLSKLPLFVDQDGNSIALAGGADLNTVTATGFYRGSSLTNAPAGDTGLFFIVVEGHDANTTKQKATTAGIGGAPLTAGVSYTLVKTNGNWSAWSKDWTSNTLTKLSQLTNDPGFQPKVSPEFQNWRETLVSNNAVGANYNIESALGNVQSLTLTANSTFTISNPPAAGVSFGLTLMIAQDATGGRTITWPAAVKWPNGVAPTLTTPASKTDFISLMTIDGGANWIGFPGSKNF